MNRHVFQFFILAAFSFVVNTEADAEGDAVKGAFVFEECKSCHQIGVGAQNWVGPHLNGVFGRPAGSVSEGNYSSNMIHAGGNGLIWTMDTLDAYLKNPRALISETRMNFVGIADLSRRTDLLAYLRLYTDDPGYRVEGKIQNGIDLTVLALRGDSEYGAYLAAECTACHQESGADQGIPSITAWPVDAFVIAMHAYKRKLRPHPVMQMMASRLNDEEIAALASYFMDLE
ncbi:MAG: c-type cytochrome [Roseobacter sp.]